MGAVYKATTCACAAGFARSRKSCRNLTGVPGMEEQTRDQFYREASTLARLDHPNPAQGL